MDVHFNVSYKNQQFDALSFCLKLTEMYWKCKSAKKESISIFIKGSAIYSWEQEQICICLRLFSAAFFNPSVSI